MTRTKKAAENRYPPAEDHMEAPNHCLFLFLRKHARLQRMHFQGPSSSARGLCIITEIREFTFAHCVLLQSVLLPYTIHTIHPKAFMNCAALQELAIPPSLH